MSSQYHAGTTTTRDLVRKDPQLLECNVPEWLSLNPASHSTRVTGNLDRSIIWTKLQICIHQNALM